MDDLCAEKLGVKAGHDGFVWFVWSVWSCSSTGYRCDHRNPDGNPHPPNSRNWHCRKGVNTSSDSICQKRVEQVCLAELRWRPHCDVAVNDGEKREPWENDLHVGNLTRQWKITTLNGRPWKNMKKIELIRWFPTSQVESMEGATRWCLPDLSTQKP